MSRNDTGCFVCTVVTTDTRLKLFEFANVVSLSGELINNIPRFQLNMKELFGRLLLRLFTNGRKQDHLTCSKNGFLYHLRQLLQFFAENSVETKAESKQ